MTATTAEKLLAVIVTGLMVLSPMVAFVSLSGVATAANDAGNTATADWPQHRGDVAKTGNASAVDTPMHIAGFDWTFSAGNSIATSAAISTGTAYFGSDDGYVYAVNITDGHQKWKFNAGDTVAASPAVRDGTVYAGSSGDTNSSVFALDADTGTKQWEFDTVGDNIESSLAVDDTHVYFGDNGGSMWGVNVSDPTDYWQRGIGPVESSPAVHNGVVYVGTSESTADGTGQSADSSLYALDAADGSTNWEFTDPGNDVASSPAVANGVVYVGDSDGTLWAVNTDGTNNWSQSTTNGVEGAPAVVDGTVYVNDDPNVYAFDAADGTQQWSTDLGGTGVASFTESSPAVRNGTMYVGSWDGDTGASGNQGTVYILNADSGGIMGEIGTNGSVRSSPTLADGKILFGGYDNDFYAFDTPASGLPVSQNFDGASEPGEWELRGDAAWSSTVDGQDTLRLTPSSSARFGTALYDRPFRSTKGAVVEFDYYANEGTGADGLSVFLVNGSFVHRTTADISGASGGPLGYGGGGKPVNGVPTGYIGVGFDEYGNFGNDGYSGSSGDEQEVSIRGTQDSGYERIVSTDVDGTFGQDVDGGWRRARITTEPIDASGDGNPDAMDIHVEMSWDDGGTWTTVVDTTYSEDPPDQLKLGFAGSTGRDTNIHAIDNLSVRKPSDLNLTVTDPSDGGVAGDSVEFTYDVTNDGPSANDQITVTDDVTTGSSGLESYSWSYTTDGASSSDSGSDTSVDLSLNDGETATVTVTATIGGSVTSDIDHTLTVSEGSGFYDRTPGDQSADHTVPTSPTADAGSYGTITEGDAVMLDASASSGAAYYEWDLDDDGNYERNETATTVPHVFHTPGTYTITLRAVTATGGSATDTATITVDPSDDWPTLGGGPARTGNNSDTASPTDLDRRWKFGNLNGAVTGPIAAADGTVYLVHRNTLYAIRADNGTETWSVDVGRQHELSVAGSTVYVAGADGDVQAFDTADGMEAWTYTTGQRSHVAVTNGTVYFTDDRTVGALDASDGSTEWTNSVSRRYLPGLTVGDGKLFVPGDTLTALNRSDGSTEWTADVTLGSAPMLDSGTLFGRTWGQPNGGGNELVAIDARTGGEQWRVRDGGITKGRMALANGELYRMTSNSIEARNRTDGSQIWENSDVAPGTTDGGIAVGDGAIYATARLTDNGQNPPEQQDFLVIDPANGSVLGGVASTDVYRGRAQFFTAPILANGTVYAGGTRGFYAFGSNTRPTADAGTDRTVEADATVNFDGTGSSDDGSIDGYDWDFGDGNTATGSSPSHTFASAGTYTVELTVTDDEGATATDTLTVTVTDTSVLVAEIRDDSKIVTEDSTVSFTSDSYGDEGIARTEWDVDGDGAFDTTGADVTHPYNDPGEYTARLRVTDNAGSIATDTINVTVTDGTDPTAAIADTSKTVTEDTAVTFDGTGSSDNDEILTYDWDFDGDGTVDAQGQRPLHVFEEPGTYTTNLTVTDGAGNSDSVEITVTVNDVTAPTANIGTDSITAASDVDITFNASNSTDNGGVTSYSWNFGDGNSRSGVTATNSYTSDGVYTVSLTVTDAAGNTDTDTVEVNVTGDTALVADAGENTTIMRDLPLSENDVDVAFDATGSTTSEGILSYEWDFQDDGTIDESGEAVTHTFSPGTDASTYPQTETVRMNLTDAQGSTVSDTVTVTFEATDVTAPTARAFRNRTTVETGQTTAFSGTIATDNVGVTGYEWDFDSDGTTDSTSGNATYTFSSPGQKEVILTVKDEAGNTDRVIETILVEDRTDPTPSVTANRTTVGIGDAINFDGTGSRDDDSIDSYQWDFGDGITAGGDETNHSFATAGTYTVTLTVTDESGNDDSTTQTITVSDTTAPTADAGSDQTVERGTTMTFDGTGSTDNVEVDSYEWDIGQDGTVDLTGRQPTHTFTATGTYTVELETIDSAGNSDTDLVSITVEDTTAPSISSYEVSNPSGQDVAVSFDSDEALPTISVSISGAESGTLTASDFTRADNGDGTYTYEATFSGSSDGDYTATIDTAEDAADNDGAGSESQTVTIETSAPVSAPIYTPTSTPTASPTSTPMSPPDVFPKPTPDVSQSTPSSTLTPATGPTQPELGVEPRHLNFENVSVGENRTLSIVVPNSLTSNRTVEVTNSRITGKHPGEFAVVNGSGATFTLEPGERREIEVRFTPQTAGTKQAQLQIVSNASVPQIDVWLSNTREYLTVQKVAVDTASEDRMVNIAGYFIDKDTRFIVNTSRPSISQRPASIEEMGMSVTRSGNFTMNVTHSADRIRPGTAITERGRSAVQYVSVDYDVPSRTFGNTSFVFTVDKASLPAGTSPEDIDFARYGDGTWATQNVTMVAESNSSYRFRATTNGFSQFVITAPETTDHVDCELFGLDYRSSIVCWYWWVLVAAIGLLLGRYLVKTGRAGTLVGVSRIR